MFDFLFFSIKILVVLWTNGQWSKTSIRLQTAIPHDELGNISACGFIISSRTSTTYEAVQHIGHHPTADVFGTSDLGVMKTGR